MSDLFPSISTLVPHLKIGNQDAWNELILRFNAGIVSRARQLLKSSDLQRTYSAEDLAQETIRKAWQQFHGFRGTTTAQFAKWVLTILRNTFINCCRSKPRDLSATWAAHLPESTSPSEAIISLEEEAELHACLAEMEPRVQHVLTMRHFEGLTFREIAARLDSKASTICGVHKRGLQRLAKLMKARSSGSLFAEIRQE